MPTSSTPTTLVLADAPTHHLDRRLQGQFAEHLGHCIDGGIWVGPDSSIANKNGIRSDVVAALREIKVPLVRWPGGCFADEYHWLKGVGPERQPMVNTHWGMVSEPNDFGTHEYFDLLHQLDAEAYVNGNVGSGSVQEMSDWIEYMTLESTSPMAELRRAHGREQPWKLEFFGVGNESWGCGGTMRPEHYADLYRQYQTFVRQYSDTPISKIACGANVDDYRWTEVLMANAARQMDGLSLHHYTIPNEGIWEKKASALDFDADGWRATMVQAWRMDELITRHGQIMDRHDPGKRVNLVVDEWGTWYQVEPGTNPGFLFQQNTVRDAVVAAIHFVIFHKHAARVRMANIAQMVNVLQAMLLTDGPRMVKTPTFHTFSLFSDHQDAEFVPVGGQFPDDVDVTASVKDGAHTISFVNAGLDEAAPLVIELPVEAGELLRAQVLTGATMQSHNTFDHSDEVAPVDLESGRDGFSVEGRRVSITLPPHSVATVRVQVRG
ncbi:alpha-N-arabinofuranosidase [Aestuariimicrobium ganziense]|uniref:alpha-N-arabinofuranosidase n=1 Tax=Aestuariimicrobium ganziense TaxID=2773677 RepID=UPI0019416F0B|nr:alpha-L-arabinofuranosidase C-terminal domain-containing protein [Aestuariimicrobium ganziense]